jgi:hypothetical protein
VRGERIVSLSKEMNGSRDKDTSTHTGSLRLRSLQEVGRGTEVGWDGSASPSKLAFVTIRSRTGHCRPATGYRKSGGRKSMNHHRKRGYLAKGRTRNAQGSTPLHGVSERRVTWSSHGA